MFGHPLTMPENAWGFTLIELIATVAMAAILLTIGVPGFQTLVQNNRMTTQVNTLVSAMNLARSVAIKRGATVTICKRNHAGSNCDNGAAWNDGWVVFSDQDGDGNFEDNGNPSLCEKGEDCLIRVYPPLPAGMVISYPNHRVTFDGAGAAPGYTGTFKFCDPRGANHARAIILDNTGRFRASTDGSDADQIHEDANGNNLTCP